METMYSHCYNFLFKEIADSRVYNWLFMSNPWIVLGILMLYLYTIFVAFPKFMSNKEPYDLKGVVKGYNIFQITANSLLVYGLATSGWMTHYTYGCQLVDYSEDETSLRMARYMWWVLILKMIDLIETVLYILRKKYKQVSALHVYHHVSTVLYIWLLIKYFPGGMATFPVYINCSVHVLMYAYYLLASFGPKMQKKLKTIKSKVTLLQIIQLFAIIIHSLQSLSPYCEFSSAYAYITVPNISINLYFFIKFYVKTYIKNKKNI